MKKFSLFLAFAFCSLWANAQQPVFFKEVFATAIADTIVYPIHGSFKIDEAGFGPYKNLQLWVYDAQNKEVYYAIQSIPTREEYADLAEKMIDKTYALFMMQHGHTLSEKCEEVAIMLYKPFGF